MENPTNQDNTETDTNTSLSHKGAIDFPSNRVAETSLLTFFESHNCLQKPSKFVFVDFVAAFYLYVS